MKEKLEDICFAFIIILIIILPISFIAFIMYKEEEHNKNCEKVKYYYVQDWGSSYNLGSNIEEAKERSGGRPIGEAYKCIN